MSALAVLPPLQQMAHPPFWRMDDPVLDDIGQVIRGGMWAHQRDWWNMPNFIRGIVTGYGGGKTISLGKRMIWLSLLNAPVPCITVSPSYPMAQTTIVQTVDELLDGRCSIEQRMTYHLYRSHPYRFEIKMGGRTGTLLCMSGEKPESLKGSNIAAAGIDEPFIMDRPVFDQVVARVRHPQAKRHEINIGGTPEGVAGWGYDLFAGALRTKHDVGLVQCSSLANLALPPGYVQRMVDSFDDEARAAYVDGQFVNMSRGRVYHSFDQTVHVAGCDDIPDGAEVAVGMDFNADPMAYVVFWRKGDRIHFIEEIEKKDSDAEKCGHDIRKDWPMVKNIYPDASGNQRSHNGAGGKSAFAFLRGLGFTICARPSNPLLPDRRNAVNAALRRGMVTVGKGCTRLCNYLLAYTHADLHKKSHTAMSHLLDAFSYPIAHMFPVDRTSMRMVTFR